MRTLSCRLLRLPHTLYSPVERLTARERTPRVQRAARKIAVVAWGKKSGQRAVQSVPATKPTLPASGQPWFVKAGIAVLAVAAILQLIKRASKRGSLGTLESRGLMTEGEQTTRSNDPFYSRMMKNVNTVQYEELTPEQISAARARRSQDRRNNERVDLSKIQLPANHPFAVSKELSEEEEQLQMARLNVRRGMPLKDVQELKSRSTPRQQP